MKLFDLNDEILLAEQQVEKYAEEHGGDITDCPFDKILGDLKGEKNEKLLSIGTWYKNLNAEAKAFAEEIKYMTIRKRVLDNKASRLKDFLAFSFEDGKKLNDSKVALSWRKSQKVFITCNDNELPVEFQITTISADKTGLKASLKAGNEIEFVSLEDNLNLQIK